MKIASDKAGNLLFVTDEDVYVTEHIYDAAGNRTGDCNRVPTTPTANYAYTGNKGTWGGEWNSYTYDALNRLVKEYEHDTALTILYAYDSLGNKIYEKNSQDEKRYTYNEMNQLVTKEAYNRTTNYEYDKRGNRILEASIHTQENRRTFEWDETNRLVKGTRGPDYGLYTSEYTYNGLGLRVNSAIMGPDKTIYDRDYVIDYTSPERNDLAEFNLGHYQWQGDKKVHDLTHLYNAAGQRLQTESARYTDWAGAKHYTRYIHEDIMGSSYYYTNPETGYVTNQHEYTTWGNNTKAPTYNYDPEYRASEPYFTGHPYDGSLNLYYAENRFYDPETGSFLSSDPAKSELNWYQYCGSNPTTYVDPLGLEPTLSKYSDEFFFAKMEDSGRHGNINSDMEKRLNKIKELVRNRGSVIVLEMLNVGCKKSTLDFLKLNEGVWWTVVESNGTYSIGYGYDFTKESNPDLYKKYVSNKEEITQFEADQLLEDKISMYIEQMDKFMDENGLFFTQNQYDALISYYYNNGQYVFTEKVYDSWNSRGGEYAVRAEARKELKNYLIDYNGNYDDQYIERLFVNSKGPSIKYEYVGRRTREANLFNQR